MRKNKIKKIQELLKIKDYAYKSQQIDQKMELIMQYFGVGSRIQDIELYEVRKQISINNHKFK